MRLLVCAAMVSSGCSLYEIGTPDQGPLDGPVIDAPMIDAVDAPRPIDALDASTAVPCTGLRLAFDDGADAFVTTLDGNQRVALAPSFGPDVGVTASGPQLALTTRRNGTYEIWAVRADGTGAHQVTHNDPQDDVNPVLAHALPALVYLRGSSLTYINVDGTSQHSLAVGAAVAPAWAPDDSRIAFALRGPNVESDLYLVDPVGSNLHALTTELGSETNPSWSPDGTRIAYEKGSSSGTNFDIWVIGADGSDPTNLTADAPDQHSPAWSPDGTRIAYSVNGDIEVIPAGGGPRMALSNDGNLDVHPQWSPDGALIAFLRAGPVTRQIVIANADGSGPHGIFPVTASSTFAWVRCPDQ